MGVLSTMGSDFIDYLISDVEVIPPAHWQFYDEKMLYLPSSFYGCQHKVEYQDVLNDESLTRSQIDIPEDKFVFAYFNQLYKLSPEILDVWCSILKRVSVLYIYIYMHIYIKLYIYFHSLSPFFLYIFLCISRLFFFFFNRSTLNYK